MKVTKTMTVNQLIKRLKAVDKELGGGGKSPVILSADDEGNGFGTIGTSSFGVHDGMIIVYPHTLFQLY